MLGFIEVTTKALLSELGYCITQLLADEIEPNERLGILNRHRG